MSDELLDAFVDEARELLDQATAALSTLQSDPSSSPALEQLFRACHTLKGSAGLMGFEPMGVLFHAAEDRLSAARSGGAGLDQDLAPALLAVLDRTESWLDAAEASGKLPAADVSALMTRLAIADRPTASAPAGVEVPPWAAALAAEPGLEPGGYVAVRYAPREDAYLMGEDPAGVIEAIPGLTRLTTALRQPAPDLEAYDPFACTLVLTALSRAAPDRVKEALRLLGDVAETCPVEVETGLGAGAPVRTVRVEGLRIDALAAAADDLAVIKNRFAHLTAEVGSRVEPALAHELAKAQSELEQRVNRLHHAVSGLRLTALAPVFRRFPRLVREISGSLCKRVELTLSGGDVELDKSVVDALFEPLLHLVRNALDHGIETPEEREAAGKPPSASLRISARAAGDKAVIEVADDGRGIDPARVHAVARERGLLGEAASATTAAQSLDLIFVPGFSTARDVGDLSGRGVGLDAVRSVLVGLGGQVEVDSQMGSGTRFSMTVPLSVRVARIVLVRAGEDTFGVPLEAVVETTRVKTEELTPVRSSRAFVWRERAMPLVELTDLLQLPRSPPRPETKVLIVNAGDEMAAVAVDDLGERMESPLRPMEGLLSRARGVVGSTLLGDGRVLIVLDLPELIG